LKADARCQLESTYDDGDVSEARMAVVKFEKSARGSSLYGTILRKSVSDYHNTFFKNAKIARIVRLLASELLLKIIT
jgi:hypothetical protein